MKRYVWGARFWFVVSAGFALVLDQVSKLLVLKYETPHIADRVFGDALRISLTMNERGLFGISYGPLWMHYALPAFVVLLVIYFAWRSPDRWTGIALGLVLGGGVSNNLVDRIRLGAVVDFIDMGFGSTRWYTYNLADAFAVAGVIMLLAHEFLGWGKAKPAAADDAAAEQSGQA
jgi:signal peptidase II